MRYLITLIFISLNVGFMQFRVILNEYLKILLIRCNSYQLNFEYISNLLEKEQQKVMHTKI